MIERLRSNHTSNPLQDTGWSGFLTFEESQIFLQYYNTIKIYTLFYPNRNILVQCTVITLHRTYCES